MSTQSGVRTTTMKLMIGFSLTLAFLLFGAAQAGAQNPIFLTVDGAGDADGASWDNAYGEAQFQTALDEAGASGEPLWVAGGEYDPGATLVWPSDAQAFGGFAVGDSELDQRDISGNETIISGYVDEEEGRQVIQTESGAVNIRIDGFTITDGEADNGGGIQLLGLDDSSVVANCRIQNCTATAGDGGGGMIVDGGSQGVVIENCVFYQNTGPGWNVEGGALSVRRGFENNATIRNSVFEENISGRGGAVGIRESVGTVIIGSEFINNTISSHQGGAMYIRDAEVTVTETLFAGNEGLWAGAVAILGDVEDQSMFVNCVFWNNTAFGDDDDDSFQGRGGAIYQQSGGEDFPTILINCTFANNVGAVRAGAIENVQWDDSGHMMVVNTIFWDNPSPDGQQIRGGRVVPTYSISDIEADGNIDADPLFVDAAAGDLQLQAGSPAIDAGDVGAAPETDILGTPRPQGEGVDIGAYEYMEGEPVVVPDLVIDGWTLEDVEAALTAAGLNVGTISQVYSDDVPDGEVIGQDPAAGSEIPEGSSVNLTISRGPAPTDMPLSGLAVLLMVLAVMAAALGSKTLLHRAK